jgi:hypothetical protein
MNPEYPRPTMNQWVSQKTRPTQFSSAKNAPGKSYEPEVEDNTTEEVRQPDNNT